MRSLFMFRIFDLNPSTVLISDHEGGKSCRCCECKRVSFHNVFCSKNINKYSKTILRIFAK